VTELRVSFVQPGQAIHFMKYGQLTFAICLWNCPTGFGFDKSHKYIDNQLFIDYTKDTGFLALFAKV
jgi:hypothetical protein